MAFTGKSYKKRRSKSELFTPKRASAAAASMQGRSRANNRRGGGGGKVRNTGARERSLGITITRNQQYGVRNTEWELHHDCRQAREQQHGQKAEGGNQHADEEWEPHHY
jgi:hypothetical protein